MANHHDRFVILAIVIADFDISNITLDELGVFLEDRH
jgi:hypothetical protein